MTYAGARYLNSDIGQWISMDPASRDNPNQFLRDPQQFNMYSYARNNPLILVDPDGEKVELFSRPINDPKIGKVGAHAFLSISPDKPGSIGSISGINTSETFTLGGYAEGFPNGTLVKGANRDLPYVSGGDGITSVTVSPPHGVDQADFERNIVSYYNSLPNEVESYHFLGQPRITGNPNSNNFATSLLTENGVSKSQVNSYQTQLFFGNGRVAPGLGTPYNTASVRESTQAAYSRLNSSLNQLKSALGKLSESLKNN